MVSHGWSRDRASERIETPWRGRGVSRRMLARLLRPILERQLVINRDLLAGIGHGQHEAHRLNARIDDTSSRLDETNHRLHSLERTLMHHQAKHDAVPFMSEPWERWEDPEAGVVEGFTTGAESDEGATYASFEARFRGSRERILDLQRVYVPMLSAHSPVLDCGCGRGELLELLSAADVPAYGVDTDEGMLASARELGLDVVTGDAIEHLRSVDAGTLGAVTAMQMIEHLPPAALNELLHEARRALRPGGRLIVETVNPHSMIALKAFWLDPTHQHPLFPDVVLELCRTAGFDRGFVMHPGGGRDVELDRYSASVYAVVADVTGGQ